MNGVQRMQGMAPTTQRGFTLVELMIRLLLGLLVVAAAGSMFFSDRRG